MRNYRFGSLRFTVFMSLALILLPANDVNSLQISLGDTHYNETWSELGHNIIFLLIVLGAVAINRFNRKKEDY